MTKGVKNIILGVTVGAVISAGIVLCKTNKHNELQLKSQETQLESPKIEKVIVYNDGSMTFLMDFPEEYGIEEEPYIEQRPDDVLYIEVYNENGEKEIVLPTETLEQEPVQKKIKKY